MNHLRSGSTRSHHASDASVEETSPPYGFLRIFQIFEFRKKSFKSNLFARPKEGITQDQRTFFIWKIFFRSSITLKVRYISLRGIIYHQEGWKWDDLMPLDLQWFIRVLSTYVSAQKFLPRLKNSENTRKTFVSYAGMCVIISERRFLDVSPSSNQYMNSVIDFPPTFHHYKC